MCKSTDVSGSIAGYYFQILLACRELTSPSDEIESIGIETGADVRIIKYTGEIESIEAKFHKVNMGRYDKDITKTMYNFYRYNFNDIQFTLSTNVSPTSTSKDFFNKWTSGEIESEEKIKYVKQCILRHSTGNLEPYRKNYSDYIENYNSQNEIAKNEREPFYYDKISSEIWSDGCFNSEMYKKYAFINEEVSYEDFVNKVRFNFREDLGKNDSIKKLKNDICLNIETICNMNENNIREEDYQKILNIIIDKFFQIIVDNSEETSPRFEDMKKFSKDILYECINKYQEIELKWINKHEIESIIVELEKEEERFTDALNLESDIGKREALIYRHNLIKQEVLSRIINKDFYKGFISIYSLDDKDTSNDILFKLIYHLTILSVYKDKEIEDIELSSPEIELMENVFIKDLIKYTYKVCSTPYKRISLAVKKFVTELESKYGCDSTKKLLDNRIVVFNSDFVRGHRPCEKHPRDIFSGLLDNIALADKETLEKRYKVLKNINCRCDNCISIGENDEETLSLINSFIQCRGERI